MNLFHGTSKALAVIDVGSYVMHLRILILKILRSICHVPTPIRENDTDSLTFSDWHGKTLYQNGHRGKKIKTMIFLFVDNKLDNVNKELLNILASRHPCMEWTRLLP
jgi:hypothetical protein